jgi:hypothetical protein
MNIWSFLAVLGYGITILPFRIIYALLIFLIGKTNKIIERFENDYEKL